MHILTRETFKALADAEGFPLISIFLPVSRSSPEVHEHEIRFKNLLRVAEKQLRAEHGFAAERASDFLRPAEALLHDELFWKYQGEGLAIFIAHKWFLPLRFPYAFEEKVFIRNHFHLLPLIPYLQAHRRFYVLAMSQKRTRLLIASEVSVTDVPINVSSGGFEQWFRLEHQDKEVQPHGVRAQAIVHGQGGIKDHKKELIEEFLRIVDSEVSALLKGEDAPLVLAAAEPLVGRFRQICSYPHLIPEDIRGNPEEVLDEELRSKGWELVRSFFDQAREQALSRYQMLNDRGQGINKLDKILEAAFAGRVESLFLRKNASKLGIFDILTGTVSMQNERNPSNDDLLETAAFQTLLHDGFLFVLEENEMPSPSPAAAILRY